MAGGLELWLEVARPVIITPSHSAMITVFFFWFFFRFIAFFLDDAIELKCLVRGVHNGRCCCRLASCRTRQERRDQTFGHHTHIDAAPPFQTQVSLQDISLFERSTMLWFFHVHPQKEPILAALHCLTVPDLGSV